MKGPLPETGASAGGVATIRGRRRGRVLFWVIGLGVLAFIAGFGVFSSHISRLAAPDEPHEADAIIVLTGGQARIDAAVDLLKSGKGKRLLISGVNPAARPEDLAKATGSDVSLFSCCVDIDKVAADTVGNAIISAQWLHRNAFASVILVTNNYHMPRSLLEMQRFGAGTEILPYPVVNTRIDRGEWLLNADALRVLFTEYTKFLAAVVRDMVDGETAPVGPTITASAG